MPPGGAPKRPVKPVLKRSIDSNKINFDFSDFQILVIGWKKLQRLKKGKRLSVKQRRYINGMKLKIIKKIYERTGIKIQRNNKLTLRADGCFKVTQEGKTRDVYIQSVRRSDVPETNKLEFVYLEDLRYPKGQNPYHNSHFESLSYAGYKYPVTTYIIKPDYTYTVTKKVVFERKQ